MRKATLCFIVLFCIEFVYFGMSEQIYGSIFLLVNISQPETHKLFAMLLVNEILNMTDIFVQKMLSNFKTMVGLFSRVLLWIIACHLRWKFFAQYCGFCLSSFTRKKKREITVIY